MVVSEYVSVLRDVVSGSEKVPSGYKDAGGAAKNDASGSEFAVIKQEKDDAALGLPVATATATATAPPPAPSFPTDEPGSVSQYSAGISNHSTLLSKSEPTEVTEYNADTEIDSEEEEQVQVLQQEDCTYEFRQKPGSTIDDMFNSNLTNIKINRKSTLRNNKNTNIVNKSNWEFQLQEIGFNDGVFTTEITDLGLFLKKFETLYKAFDRKSLNYLAIFEIRLIDIFNSGKNSVFRMDCLETCFALLVYLINSNSNYQETKFINLFEIIRKLKNNEALVKFSAYFLVKSVENFIQMPQPLPGQAKSNFAYLNYYRNPFLLKKITVSNSFKRKMSFFFKKKHMVFDKFKKTVTFLLLLMDFENKMELLPFQILIQSCLIIVDDFELILAFKKQNLVKYC